VTTEDFATILSTLAGQLSPAQIRSWCAILDGAAGPDVGVETALTSTLTGPGTTGSAERLLNAWRRLAPSTPGAAVALALTAATDAHEEADRRRPRLVISGPASPAAAVRLTSSVVIDVVRAATDRVLLVSFAAHGVTEVVRELATAADRGVRVDLVLETTADHGGALRGGPGSGAFDALASRVTFWHWPPEHRPGGRAALHAKVLVADGQTALLTSANFTDRGLAHNIEVGLLVRDREIAGRLEDHLRSLMLPRHGASPVWSRAGGPDRAGGSQGRRSEVYRRGGRSHPTVALAHGIADRSH
jgi:phosphatidylserine/phosphatidylglycerophosphate/cardiolipin synthase-like enzyme